MRSTPGDYPHHSLESFGQGQELENERVDSNFVSTVSFPLARASVFSLAASAARNSVRNASYAHRHTVSRRVQIPGHWRKYEVPFFIDIII